MRQALDDAATVYTLGFYPDAATADGKYHKLEIALRRRGVEIRYRPGYLTAGEVTEKSALDGRGAMRDAMVSPLESDGIRFSLHREALGSGQAGPIQLSVTIPPEDLELQAADNGWSGTLDLAFFQCDKAGYELASDGKELKIELSQQRYEAFLKEGLTLRRNVTLEAAASEIRFVLFDRVSGRVGSLRFPAR